MSSSLHGSALGALESLINRALALDPHGNERLQALAGHSFRLQCTQPALDVTLHVTGQGVLLQAGDNTRAGTTLTGSWDEFAKIAVAEDPGAALINGNVRVDGDTARVLALRDALAALELDWEAPLAELVGDVAAHQLGRTLRQTGRWARQAFGALRRQSREFLLEESQWVPHPIEVEDFYREVDELALRTEKLQARLQQLRQRLNSTTDR